MTHAKIMGWMGVLIAVAGVLASPEFGHLVPHGIAALAIAIGTVAAALSRSLVGISGAQLSWLGIATTTLAALGSPDVVNVLPMKWAGLIGLAGALMAAAGGAIQKNIPQDDGGVDE
jgi:hypothetical protein